MPSPAFPIDRVPSLAGINWDPEAALAAHFLLNDNLATSVVLDTTGVNNGVLMDSGGAINTSTVSVAGKINTAFDLDGGDEYITVPHDASLIFSLGYSIAFWMKTDDNTKDQVIIAKRTADVCSFQVSYLGNAMDVIMVYMKDNHGNTFTGATGANAITDTNWHHVVVTYHLHLQLVSYYIDGELESTDNNAAAHEYLGNTTAMLIGQYDDADYFDGSLDDIRLYSRPLSADEVRGIYNFNAGTEDESGNWNPLRGAWLNKATSNGMEDYSAEGNDLTLMNGDPQPEAVGWDFDGVGDSFERAVLAGFDEDEPFSVTLWANLDDVTTQQCLLENSIGAAAGFGIIITGSEARTGIWDGGAYAYRASGTWATIGAWVHLAVTFDRTAILLYINGVAQVGTNAMFLGLNAGLEIGSRTGGGQPTNGRIKDIRMYTGIAMSADWVRMQYLLGVPS